MLCRNPFVRERDGSPFLSHSPKDWLRGVPFGCGRCLPCRIKKRREWTTRLILEMLASHHACFLTLTYNEDYVPTSESGERTLSKRDLQLFLKRFRRNLELLKKRSYPIRYFAVGEYGSRGTQRPHYHIILFGCSSFDIDVLKSIDLAWREPAGYKQKGDTPSFGIWTCDELNEKRVAYAAGYVSKKLIVPSRHFKVVTVSKEVGGKRYTYDRSVLDRESSSRDAAGRLAEFRTMSRMPGLGSGFIGDLLALYQSNAAFRKVLHDSGDVPSIIRAYGRNLFLDRFIKEKLRDALGIEPDNTAFLTELRNQFFSWVNDKTMTPRTDFYSYLVAIDDQRYKQLVDKVKRQLQRRSKIE